MLRRKLRESLTFRIFSVTCLLLLLAGAVTFGFIVWATPTSYLTIMTSDLDEKAEVLAERLSATAFDDSGPLLDAFVRDEADVMIVGPDGKIVQTPSNLAVSPVYEDDDENVVVVSIGGGEDTLAVSSDVSGAVAETVSVLTSSDASGEMTYAFEYPDRQGEYTMVVSPRVRVATNQAVSALGKVAPWLLAVMLVFSVLCALFYSRYITRPIVRLSGISQRMAELDFDWKCGEKRLDEIGVLGRSLDELSGRLSAALGDLQTANETLKSDIDRERELERQRLQFFSAASHELKTPVTILKGQLTGMLEGVDVYQDRDAYLAKSLRVTARMEALVQEILTVSRIESNGFALREQPTDLGEAVSAQLALDEDLIELKGLALTADLPTGTIVSADPVLLRKVLDNILSNAVFYAPEGAKLRVALQTEPEEAVLTVENSGSHIPEDALAHVFEAFYRADSSRNRRTGGSGLGLYIVKMILDRHGAGYAIQNTADGVRFTIRWPKKKP